MRDRRRSYSRRTQAHAFARWKVAVIAGAGITAAAVLAVLGQPGSAATPLEVERHLVYTAPTVNDAPVALPESVKADLREVGLRQGKTALTRIDSRGEATTSIIDLTARANDDPDGPVLKVNDRALAAINTKIATVEFAMNNPRASTGDRALFVGLTKTTFSAVPVTVISSGLDLSAPVDFRSLNWNVHPQQVVATVKKAGELPGLAGAPVTFVVVPPAGAQEQLRQAQRNYRNAVWTALLTSSGAPSVTFIDTVAGGDTVGGPSTTPTPAPTVALPPLPKTPIPPITDPSDSKRTLCMLPSSTHFRVDEAALIDKAKTVHDLQPCITAALAAKAAIELDGWTSYVGPLTPDGKPAVDAPENRRLSTARVSAIADLLVKDMQVPKAKITRLQGHGNVGQPHPNPRHPANRVVIISYLTQ